MITPERYKNAKWEDVPNTIKEAYTNLWLIEKKKGLYIHGAVGTGKTHICWAIKNDYDNPAIDPRNRPYIQIYNVVDLMHDIKADFDRQAIDKRRPEDYLTDPERKHLLILDDIGVEKATDFVAETLYRIINARYIHILPTIFTSNHTIQELADRIGERSASRIVEMSELIELTGGDRRIQK